MHSNKKNHTRSANKKGGSLTLPSCLLIRGGYFPNAMARNSVLLTCFSWAPDTPTPHNLDDLLDFNDPHNNWLALVGISSMHPIGV